MNKRKICEEKGHDWGDWHYEKTGSHNLRRDCRACGAHQTRPAVGHRFPRIIENPRVPAR